MCWSLQDDFHTKLKPQAAWKIGKQYNLPIYSHIIPTANFICGFITAFYLILLL